MFFIITSRYYTSLAKLKNDRILQAYISIKNYPFKANDLLMNQFIEQKYEISLRELCIKLLFNLTFFKNKNGNLVASFKDPRYDKLARLVTYGDGLHFGSPILKDALSCEEENS